MSDINNRYLRYLRHPMYRLYYVKEASGLARMTPHDIATFRTHYSPDLTARIVDAIEWAIANPDFDLTDVLPSLGHSNEDIRSYLQVVLATLRREGLA